MNKEEFIWCTKCETGDAIFADAFAQWNIENQEWEMTEVHDHSPCCGRCGSSAHVEWKEG